MRGVLELPPDLDAVQNAVAGALERVDRVFRDQLRSDLPVVNTLCAHVERYRGKMLRPTLVLLCGLAAHPAMCARESAELLTDEHVVMAAVCEMVHMATLVHDDVLDEAEVRRRGRTINALRGNEAAVMLGDYLIASAYHLCSQLASQDHALAIGHVSRVLCSGELLQIDHREDWSLDEATYFEILGRKTASLIAVACERGALISGADRSLAARLASYGRRLGVAFQIQDDLLDLTGREQVVGKSVGRDLAKGKVTLPLILHLANAGADERAEIVRLLEAAAHEEGESARTSLARRLADSGSIARAKAIAESLVADAKGELSHLPDTAARRVLLHMADATIARAS